MALKNLSVDHPANRSKIAACEAAEDQIAMGSAMAFLAEINSSTGVSYEEYRRRGM